MRAHCPHWSCNTQSSQLHLLPQSVGKKKVISFVGINGGICPFQWKLRWEGVKHLFQIPVNFTSKSLTSKVVLELRGTSNCVNMNKLQAYVAQHRDYS